MVVKNGQMLTRPTSRSRRMSGELLVLTSKIVATTIDVMSGDAMTTAMIGTMITATTATTTVTDVVIGKTTLGGGRAPTA
jgi:hypothetical protein